MKETINLLFDAVIAHQRAIAICFEIKKSALSPSDAIAYQDRIEECDKWSQDILYAKGDLTEYRQLYPLGLTHAAHKLEEDVRGYLAQGREFLNDEVVSLMDMPWLNRSKEIPWEDKALSFEDAMEKIKENASLARQKLKQAWYAAHPERGGPLAITHR